MNYYVMWYAAAAASNDAAANDGTLPSAQQQAIDTCDCCTASVAAMVAMQTGESRDIKCQPTNNQPANDWLQQPLLLATSKWQHKKLPVNNQWQESLQQQTHLHLAVSKEHFMGRVDFNRKNKF